MKKPNILILHTDQQRWDTIKANGNSVIKNTQSGPPGHLGNQLLKLLQSEPRLYAQPHKFYDRSVLFGTENYPNGCNRPARD
jgi:arylsulfatase A-like enzyme